MRSRTALSLLMLMLALGASGRAEAFTAKLPPAWSPVRFPLTTTTLPMQRYAAASFRLRSSPPTGCGLAPAVRAQIPGDAAIMLVVSWGPSTGASPRRLGRPVRLGRLGEMECFGRGYDVAFAAGGEDLQAFVLVRGTPSARRLHQVRGLLASFTP